MLQFDKINEKYQEDYRAIPSYDRTAQDALRNQFAQDIDRSSGRNTTPQSYGLPDHPSFHNLSDDQKRTYSTANWPADEQPEKAAERLNELLYFDKTNEKFQEDIRAIPSEDKAAQDILRKQFARDISRTQGRRR